MPSPPLKKDEVIEFEVQSMTNQGSGVGRFRGFVVFVDFVAPGESVRAQVTSVKKNFARARLLEVLDESSERREPLCKVFGQCGGCQWQHLSYSLQLQQKKSLIEQALQKFSGLSEWPSFEVQASPKEYHYRNRIQLHIHRGQVGYHAKGSHQIVPINECPLAEPLVSQKIAGLDRSTTQRGELRREGPAVRWITEAEELGFRQVNDGQNTELLESARQLIDDVSPQRVLDLFCGSGNFSFFLAEHFPQMSMIGSDSNAKSINEANQKRRKLDLSNLEFLCEDSHLTLRRENQGSETLALIDPPRRGCSAEFIEDLQGSHLQTLLYVSCDPVTFARDFSRLNSGGKWQLRALKAFDMFPQTPHVEILGLFLRGPLEEMG